MRDELWIGDNISRTRFIASVFMTSAMLCLALAMLGVYGIVSQSVAQRRREIAVRIFLGATPGGILKLILREGNVFASAGIALGLFLTVRTVGWLGTFVGNEDISGAMFFGGLSIALFGTATLAALVPGARATMVDPAEALRAE
jgi:putative ABC transport system permease protein